MVQRYQRGTAGEQRAVFDAYLAHLAHINNWDLVDSSAGQIVGPQILKTDPDGYGLCFQRRTE